MIQDESKFKVQSSKLEERAEQGVSAGGRADFEPGTLNFELIVSDVRKSFRGPAGGALEVLRGASLLMKAGEALAVVGASGAGKSTLLHVLCGLEAADSGGVSLGGFDIARARRIGALRGREVGSVQFHHLSDLTAEENGRCLSWCARALARGERERRGCRRRGLAARRTSAGHPFGGEQRSWPSLAHRPPPAPRARRQPTEISSPQRRRRGRTPPQLCRERRAFLFVATHNEHSRLTCASPPRPSRRPTPRRALLPDSVVTL